MSEYRVNLDIFAGPLDLLLYLVRKEEVDIYDIPIAKITKQYLEYVELIKMFDLDLAGDFLVLAATLMEIKSIMLLPSPELEEGEEGETEDPRKELVRQLLEYKKFKDAANLLGDAAEERKQRFTRTNYILEKIKPTEEPELDLDQVSIWTLLEAFDTIMRSVGNLGDSYKHITDDTPIDLYQIELLDRLQTDGPMSLQKVFEGGENKLQMIGLFLGMLELIRNKLIWAEQPELDGPIYLKPLVTEPAEQAVHNAIYASPEAMERDAEQLPAKDQSPEDNDSDESPEDEPDVSADMDDVVGADDDELEALEFDEDNVAEMLDSTDVETSHHKTPPIRIVDLPAENQSMPAKEHNQLQEEELQ